MAAITGTGALALALVVALYGAIASVAGARRKSAALVESARTSGYALVALVAAANGAMLAAILSNDFSIRYVAENSSRATPTFFKALSLWSADEGSLLLWNLVLAGFIAAVAFRFRTRRPETFPWALATMFGVAVFYLVLVLGPTTPFGTLAEVPLDGRGPLPLLQNHPLMAAHPPMLYLGFVGFTVPFAFAVGALATGRLTDQWIRATRRWTLAAWTFLTLGLVLGALWSYQVLGWGGYWAWDPVENVALLPWLMGTAFLHSVMVQERRGMLKVWNLTLIVGTFALTVLGTFLTRGSILSSVHTFAQSIVGPLYLGFLGLVLVGGFGLIAARSRLLHAEATFDTPVSRESAFLGNNLLLLVVTFTVLLGTLHPLLVEALTGDKVSVGGPYFNGTTVPVILLLLFLMGIGPLVPWRAGSPGRVARRLRVPVWSGAVVAGTLALAGVRSVGAILAFGLAAFVAAATISELARGVRSYREAHGGTILEAAVGATRRNPRLHGGLIAHLGLVLAAVAITASASFRQQTELALSPGERASFAGHDLVFEGVRSARQPHRDVVTADLVLLDEGEPVARLTPSLNFYPGATEPIGSPSIRTGSPGNLFRDLYAALVSVTDGGEATIRMYLNPGVTWLWIGGAVMVLGGLLAAWPSRRPPRSRPSVPERPAEAVAVR